MIILTLKCYRGLGSIYIEQERDQCSTGEVTESMYLLFGKSLIRKLGLCLHSCAGGEGVIHRTRTRSVFFGEVKESLYFLFRQLIWETRIINTL